MAIHTILLEDGSQITAGGEALPSIRQVTLTENVNTQEAFCWGSVFSSCLQVSLFCRELPVWAGQQLRLYREGQLQGVFWVDTAERTGKGIYLVTAFDALSRLDKDLTGWLSGLSHWPYTLSELAQLVCAECGLTLLEGELPCGDFPVGAFQGADVTGRRLLGWIAQATGTFCRATPQGQVALARYESRELTLRPGQESYYLQGSYAYEDEIGPIDQVQLRQNEGDIGTLYPADIAGENVYVVEGNPLLQAENATHLEEIAKNLYESMENVVYSPGKVTVPASLQIAPGQVISIADTQGDLRSFYVMERIRSAGTDSLVCRGVGSREKVRIANRQDVKALSGKVLQLQADVDGVLLQNENARGELTRLELQLGRMQTQVLQQQEEDKSLKTQLSTLEQSSRGLELRLEEMEQNGPQQVQTSTGYRFDKEGLWISKSGEEMENRLDHTGMYVRRSGQVILQANSQGVEAADVTVRNYLNLGQYARLEDFSDGADSRRTACYWIGDTYGTV